MTPPSRMRQAVADSAPLPGARSTPSDGSRRRTVLVVEDNLVNRLLVSHQLDRLGFDVELVADGYGALDAIECGELDLVLMDWQMPGIDGIETARRIRCHERDRELPRTPIVAVTASAMPGDREQLIGAGMDDVLHKPVGIDVLSATLDRWALRSTAEHRDRSTPPVDAGIDAAAIACALDELVLDLGDRSVVVAVVQTYLDDLPDRVGAIAGRVGAARSTAAHTLKSSSLVVGVHPLASLCADIESRPTGSEVTQLPDLARDATRVLEEWIEAPVPATASIPAGDGRPSRCTW